MAVQVQCAAQSDQVYMRVCVKWCIPVHEKKGISFLCSPWLGRGLCGADMRSHGVGCWCTLSAESYICV